MQLRDRCAWFRESTGDADTAAAPASTADAASADAPVRLASIDHQAGARYRQHHCPYAFGPAVATTSRRTVAIAGTDAVALPHAVAVAYPHRVAVAYPHRVA